MASEQLAGHPISIRKGGRRMSQSNPIRSPTKSQSSTSAPSSPDESTKVREPLPDYPRPAAPASANTSGDVTKESNGGTDPVTQNQTGNDNNPQVETPSMNRQERRRQERRKDYKKEDGQQRDDPNYMVKNLVNEENKLLQNLKGSKGKDVGGRKLGGTGGMRITQPSGKGLA